MLENTALWSDEFFPMLYFTGQRINKELMCLYFILLITLSIFPKLKFWLKGTSSVMAQCSGSAGGSSVIIYGPTLSTQFEDLAKPGGMPFKVAACLLYYSLYKKKRKHYIIFNNLRTFKDEHFKLIGDLDRHVPYQ